MSGAKNDGRTPQRRFGGLTGHTATPKVHSLARGLCFFMNDI